MGFWEEFPEEFLEGSFIQELVSEAWVEERWGLEANHPSQVLRFQGPLGQALEDSGGLAPAQGLVPSREVPSREPWCLVEPQVLPQLIKLPRLVLGWVVSEDLVAWLVLVAWECPQVPWCLSQGRESELESELERNRGKCRVWGSQVCTQEECFQAQELAFLELECSLAFPLAQE